MKPAFRPAAVLALALLLAACGGEKETAKGDRSAEGEILEGSASDAMLPLDTVRSQPPLAPHSGDAAGKKDDASDAASDKPSDAAESPPPAASAEPAQPSAKPSPKPSAE